MFVLRVSSSHLDYHKQGMNVHVVVITHRAGSFGVAGMVSYNAIPVTHQKGWYTSDIVKHSPNNW
jgi:hypothetical protein